MTLSVCIICKNEEKNIRRCLESIKNIADEVVVVDTGSTDNTIKIAKEYNVKLIEHNWNNDFSEARNVSIRNATCDWILILDADETIDNENALKLLNLINTITNYEGLFISLTNIVGNKEASKAVVFRVFKNNPLYRFEGKIHEQVIKSIFKYHSQKSILDSDIKILHYGYDLNYAEEKVKSKRNLDILLNYNEEDKDGYYYFSLGNELIRANDYENCIKSYKKSIELTNFPVERPIYLPYLIFNIIKLLLTEDDIEEANEYFKFYIRYFNDFKDLYFLGALSELSFKRYSTAKKYMDKYKTIIPSHNLYPSNNLEESYNIIEINKAIEQGLFIENNPPLRDETPLTICVVNTCYKNKIRDSLESIKKINCRKILITTEPLDNEEALKLGSDIEVFETKFNNDYSELKNYALKNILSNYKDINWVMYLESSEVLTYEGLLKLQKLLIDSTKYKVFEVKVIVNNNSQITIKDEIRLFKYSDKLEFRGKLYDEITSSSIEVFGKELIANVDVSIVNYVDKLKLEERLSVLDNYKESEKDSLYFFYKGNNFFRLKDFSMASRFYKESFTNVHKEKALISRENSTYIPLLALNLSISLLNIGDYNGVIYYTDIFLNYYKEFGVLYIIQAFAKKQLALDYGCLLEKYKLYKEDKNYPFINLEYLIQEFS